MKTQSLPFDQLIKISESHVNKHITKEQFERWKQDFSFNALHDQRYGQSFCNTFGITDYLLYYTPWTVEQINKYIEKNYIKNE